MKLWFRNGLTTILWECAVMLIYVAISMISGGDPEGALLCTPYYLLMGGAIFSVVLTVSSYRLYLPVYLSLGSTRRSAMYGLHMMSLLPVAATVLLCGAYCLLLQNDISASLRPLLPLAGVGLLMLTMIGHGVGCSMLRFSKLGRAINLVLIGLVAACAGGLGGWLTAGEALPLLPALSHTAWLTVIAAAATLALLLVILPFQRSTLLRCEVKL